VDSAARRLDVLVDYQSPDEYSLDDMSRLIDYMLEGWPDASRIDPQRIGLYGFRLAATPASSSSAAIPICARDCRIARPPA